MSAHRGEDLKPPSKWQVRAYDRRAALGWQQLAGQAPANLRRAWFAMTDDPRSGADPGRQHRLKGTLGATRVNGSACEQWQYEVTAGGRVWYAIDDAAFVLWITYAGTAHPRQTDRRG